ncbi:MAG: DinB family protein [Holophagales bacterium]|nr:DinB family protein [Holophagales bacterium]
MYSLDHLLSSMRHETKIIKHLHGKLSAEQLDFRPAEGMRSTLELLRYLSYCGIATAEALVTGDWAKYHARAAAAEELSADELPQAADRQMAELEALVEGLSAEDLAREVDCPGGGTGLLGAALINHPSRYLATYRMQLFVYAKASGCAELSTWNNWGGEDPPETETAGN